MKREIAKSTRYFATFDIVATELASLTKSQVADSIDAAWGEVMQNESSDQINSSELNLPGDMKLEKYRKGKVSVSFLAHDIEKAPTTDAAGLYYLSQLKEMLEEASAENEYGISSISNLHIERVAPARSKMLFEVTE